LSEICQSLEKKDIPVVTNLHKLADYEKNYPNTKTGTDIKTKVMYLDSQPKGFSIDDVLRFLCEENTVFLFYWVGIEQDETLKLQLLPIFDKNMLKNSYIQKHWSGINSRGHVQFDGKSMKVILGDDNYSVTHLSERDAIETIMRWVEA
ncbi:MAG: hypothetical protein FWG38_06420, partial [Defluviitaleaceae bacterium]|nr:hypothetical protein [Defluviitaleaceae bacterium]